MRRSAARPWSTRLREAQPAGTPDLHRFLEYKVLHYQVSHIRRRAGPLGLSTLRAPSRARARVPGAAQTAVHAAALTSPAMAARGRTGWAATAGTSPGGRPTLTHSTRSGPLPGPATPQSARPPGSRFGPSHARAAPCASSPSSLAYRHVPPPVLARGRAYIRHVRSDSAVTRHQQQPCRARSRATAGSHGPEPPPEPCGPHLARAQQRHAR